jgi:hypothetical protein
MGNPGVVRARSPAPGLAGARRGLETEVDLVA